MVWHRTRRWRSRGFTLIEMLCVIICVAALAVIAIPHLLGAQRKAKEAQLVGNLKMLRDAIERFESNVGAWPPALSDVIAVNGAAISANLDGRGGRVDRKAYDGPYTASPMTTLPKDPFTEKSDWSYNNATGAIHSASTMLAVNGTPYKTW
jgi:prepilin-type N-terminal cleavage/methylation domain-containing protein